MFHLLLEVIALFCGGNSAIDDVVTRVARFRVVLCFLEEIRDVVLPVSATCSNGLDFALRFPGAKGGRIKFKLKH